MDYKYELVDMDEKMPVKIIIHTSNQSVVIPRHWHDSLEMSYVLTGEIDHIYIDGTEYTSREGDIVLINSNAIHSFSLGLAENRKAVTVLIPYEFVKENYSGFEQLMFNCVSINETSEHRLKHFVELREKLDNITETFINKNNDPLAPIQITALAYEIVYILLKYFKEDNISYGVIKTNKYLKRLTLVTEFIKQNYNQDLSIEYIASQFSLSSEYLSRLFTKHMGLTVLNYINAIRLENSYRELMNTDYSILDIALKHGFPNIKSYNRVFKSVYHITPHQYRKHNKVHTNSRLRSTFE
jgi:AraC family transcriptional regulator, melibiose operon regulatory protein